MSAAEYVSVLGRRWWLILLCAAAALGTAFVALRAQPPVYRATVRLEVSGRVDHAHILAIDRLLRQIAARVTTTSIAEEADRRLGLGLGADGLLAIVHTQALPETLQIRIDVDDVDPGRARRIAAAVAEVMQERQTAQMLTVPAEEQVVLNIVDRPSEVHSIWPQPWPVLLAAALLGLLAGSLIAFVWDYADDTLKSPREVERIVGVPLLGVVPPEEIQGLARAAASRAIAPRSTVGSHGVGPLASVGEGDRPR